jgi:hypothetical protein
LASATPASAFSYANGDLILVFVKGGFEVIANEGQTPTSGANLVVQGNTLPLPPSFGGTVFAADWTALSVRNPNQTADVAGATLNTYNLILTSTQDPSQIQYNDIGNAQAVLSPAGGGTGWLQMLTQIGPANSSTILTNTANTLVISSGLLQSYETNVGLGTDTVGNTLPISTSSIVDADTMPLYELIQNPTVPPAGGLHLGVTLDTLGQITVTPEPGTALLLGAGLLGLVHFGRRRG